MKCDTENSKEKRENNRTWSKGRQEIVAIIVQRESLSMGKNKDISELLFECLIIKIIST